MARTSAGAGDPRAEGTMTAIGGTDGSVGSADWTRQRGRGATWAASPGRRLHGAHVPLHHRCGRGGLFAEGPRADGPGAAGRRPLAPRARRGATAVQRVRSSPFVSTPRSSFRTESRHRDTRSRVARDEVKSPRLRSARRARAALGAEARQPSTVHRDAVTVPIDPLDAHDVGADLEAVACRPHRRPLSSAAGQPRPRAGRGSLPMDGCP